MPPLANPAGCVADAPDHPPLRTARLWLARASRVLRAVMGAPDYAAYLAHMRERHPGAPPLGRDAFERERLAARYERPGSRCC